MKKLLDGSIWRSMIYEPGRFATCDNFLDVGQLNERKAEFFTIMFYIGLHENKWKGKIMNINIKIILVVALMPLSFLSCLSSAEDYPYEIQAPGTDAKIKFTSMYVLEQRGTHFTQSLEMQRSYSNLMSRKMQCIDGGMKSTYCPLLRTIILLLRNPIIMLASEVSLIPMVSF